MDPVQIATYALLAVAAVAFAHMAWVDLRTGYLFNRDQLLAAICGIGIVALGSPLGIDWILSLIGCVMGGGLFWGLRWLVSRMKGREAMGEGDIYLAATAGIWLGPFGLAPMMTWAGVLTLIAFGIVALIRRKADMGAEIPFGPGLIAGIVLTFAGGALDLPWLALNVDLNPLAIAS